MYKKNMLLIFAFILCISILSVLIIKRISNERISVKEPNIIGNNTNNIIQGMDASIQDDYIYYGNPTGLYRVNVDGSKRKLLDRGDIRNVNVIGDWIYYVKVSDKKIQNGIISSPDLYKIKINGNNKKLVTNYSYNVNVIGDKIFYIKTIWFTGNRNEEEVDNFDFSLEDALIMHDINTDEEKVIINGKIDNFVMNDKKIYYKTNNKLYSYNITSNDNKYLFDMNDRYYILTDKGIAFFSYVERSIKMYNFETNSITVLKENIDMEGWYDPICVKLYNSGNTLYYTSGRKHLFSYNLDTGEEIEIENDVSTYDIHFLDNRIFSIDYYNEVIEIEIGDS